MDRANEALSVCEDQRPAEAGDLPLLLATPTTAGDITRDARAADRRPIEPWDALAPGHFVAECSFGNDPDGETVSYFVDEAGRSSLVDPGEPPPL